MTSEVQTISVAVASASVTIAAFYYIWQIRHQSKLRQTDMVMRTYATYQSIEFQTAIQTVRGLTLRDSEDYDRCSDDDRAALNSVELFFESIGILVKRNLISMDLVDDLISTDIIRMWEKMKPVIEAGRKREGRPQICEYFEYLYNEMKKREQEIQKSKV